MCATTRTAWLMASFHGSVVGINIDIVDILSMKLDIWLKDDSTKGSEETERQAFTIGIG